MFLLSESSASEYVRIIPIRGEQSGTHSFGGVNFGADLAIDDNVDTMSITTGGKSQWIIFTLDDVHCVHQVVAYYYKEHEILGLHYHTTTFTCSKDGCTCDGDYCDSVSLEVTGAGAGTSKCKNGNTLMLPMSFSESDPEVINVLFSEFAVYESNGKKCSRFNL